jgi:hypothetical protein
MPLSRWIRPSRSLLLPVEAVVPKIRPAGLSATTGLPEAEGTASASPSPASPTRKEVDPLTER